MQAVHGARRPRGLPFAAQLPLQQGRAHLDEHTRVPCLAIRGAGLADLQASARGPHAAHAQAGFQGVRVEQGIWLPGAAGGQDVRDFVDDLR